MHQSGGHSAREEWKQLNVILSGGGLLRLGLKEVIDNYDLTKLIFFHDSTRYDVNWHHPSDLDFNSAPTELEPSILASNSAFLTVANGLSLERRRWPNFFPPGEVMPLDMPAQPENPYERSYADSDVG
jgi:hypothetical protein